MLGAGFDCASRAEIEQVLGLGVAADRIIFANTVKMRSHLAFARLSGVAEVTFDDANELEKIRECYRCASCLRPAGSFILSYL